ncbi:MAG: peptidase S10, partial [Phycisphaerae bacterium]
PGKLIENPHTWLTDTDLVFIDPVGTGYSRAATPEQSREFYSVNEDVASVAEFIRLYTTQYGRWESPKFLAGESYGTTRAAALAEHLHDHKGLALNGVILISTVLNFADLRPQEGNDLPYALQLPTYTATAFFHHKLPPELQKNLRATLDEVEKFTLDVYIPALAKGSTLDPSAAQKLAEQLARYTGLAVSYIQRNNLRIDPSRFEKELLNANENARILGRMDTRITAYTADAAATTPDFDPALSGYLPLYTSAFNSYVRGKLRYENDLPYEILSGRVGPWNFGGNGATGFLYVGDNLRNAMQKNPHLRVLVASGYFDLATPYFATDYTLNHLNLPAPLRDHLQHVYYPGGHMMYHEPSSLEKLHQDISRFIQQATADK